VLIDPDKSYTRTSATANAPDKKTLDNRKHENDSRHEPKIHPILLVSPTDAPVRTRQSSIPNTSKGLTATNSSQSHRCRSNSDPTASFVLFPGGLITEF